MSKKFGCKIEVGESFGLCDYGQTCLILVLGMQEITNMRKTVSFKWDSSAKKNPSLTGIYFSTSSVI